jgi:GNAT superfamily N-acetyltransferase
MLTISPIDSGQDFQQFANLVQEFTAWDRQETERLGLDFNYVEMLHTFESQLDQIPAEYTLPEGCLLLARHENEVGGCVGLKRLNVTNCELKRLYVRPAYRGHGIGRALAQEAIQQARVMEYTVMQLETARFMVDAIVLYTSLGFHEIEPFREIPENIRRISVFMELDLSR